METKNPAVHDQTIAIELKITAQQVMATVELLDEGSTVPLEFVRLEEVSPG